jgi:hypothetical protein
MKALRGGDRGIALHIFNLGICGGGWSTPWPICFTTQERALVLIVQGAGSALGLVWMGVENPACTGVEPQTAEPIVCYNTKYPFSVT